MVTEFNNGMIMGVHARAAGIIGLTLDTQTQSGTAGAAKKLALNLGQNSYAVDAVYTDPATLAIDLRGIDGGGRAFAERLTTLGSFRILMDDTSYYFSTAGFTDGLARLQACMGGAMSVPLVVTNDNISKDAFIDSMRVTSSGTRKPLALAMPDLVPAGYRFVLDGVDPMTLINWQPGDDWLAVLRSALSEQKLGVSVKGRIVRIANADSIEADTDATEAKADDVKADIENMDVVADDAPTPIVASVADEAVSDAVDDTPPIVKGRVGVWKAAKGKALSDVLSSWAMLAGVKVKMDLDKPFVLPRAVKYDGSFDDAVSALLSEFKGDAPTGRYEGAGLGDRAQQSGPAFARKTASFARQAKAFQPTAPVMRTQAKKPLMATNPNGPWEGLEGAQLRDVLEAWSPRAGVKLVWMTPLNFELNKTVTLKTGAFDKAVVDVLSQFKGQRARPVAELNTDPDTGEKTLTIKAVKR